MTLVTELDLPVIDLDAAGQAGDGYHRLLAGLREQGWLASSAVALLVLDRAAGEFFLRSRATAFPGRELADLFGITAGPLRKHIDANILNQQGERHGGCERWWAGVHPRAADRWRQAMRRFLRQLWDSTGAGGSADFVAAVAKPYPSLTIAAVLGAPEQDAPLLHRWSSLVQKQFDIRALGTSVADIEQAVTAARSYAEALLRQRRDEPGDDLITSLLAAEDRGDRLSHDECVDLVLNVIAGGVDTPRPSSRTRCGCSPRTPGSGSCWPRTRPWLAARWKRCCGSSRSRRSPRGSAGSRWTPRRDIPASTIVAICAERANREQDGGESFDITAERDGRLLTFQRGAHFCLGANLARAELEEALAFLAPRMPGLAADGRPAWAGWRVSTASMNCRCTGGPGDDTPVRMRGEHPGPSAPGPRPTAPHTAAPPRCAGRTRSPAPGAPTSARSATGPGSPRPRIRPLRGKVRRDLPVQPLAPVDHREERQDVRPVPVEAGDEFGQLVQGADRQRGRNQRHQQRVGRVEHTLGQQRDTRRAVQEDGVVLALQRGEQAGQAPLRPLRGVEQQVEVPVGKVGRQQVKAVVVGSLDRGVECLVPGSVPCRRP